ncbi:MAG: DNA recombination protein RmuC [Rhodospirillales bacterium]|jgi:DNA recombination protein RmuC|nr:DNA recombination protein RmuC [Rhodospirillales bacterium]
MEITFPWPSGAVLALAASVLAVAALAVMALMRAERARGEAAAHLARLAEMSERLQASQARLVGRLEQAHGAMNQRLDALSRRLGDSLFEQGERTGETLRALGERLAVIDAAQRRIAELSNQVVGLHDILGDKQARGAFGEMQLKDLVSALLPAAAYAFQVTLRNGCRADCLLQLPDPPGPIVVDAKFPLESFRALRKARGAGETARAGRAFAADVLRHVRDIEAKYLVPGETADAALMFLPSEAVYAEVHASLPAVVEESFRRKVWIVSPTTLWATLSTLRGVLRDVRLREQAQAIQAELRALTDDVGRLDARAARLQRHLEAAAEDLRQVRLTSERVAARAGRIDVLQLDRTTAPAADRAAAESQAAAKAKAAAE